MKRQRSKETKGGPNNEGERKVKRGERKVKGLKGESEKK